ncbi:MAG: ATP-binding protein [Sediminispirochaetaceae bacterium]
MPKRIIPREITDIAKNLFSKYPIITITGPRQSGKTTFVRDSFPGLDYVNLEDMEERGFAREDPKGFLRRHHSGVILDEIQNVPDLPSWLQVHVDETGEPGQFILTGSRQFEVMEAVSQSLAGRTAMLKLLPFSIGELCAAGWIRSNDDLIHRGFYPRIYSSGLDPNRVLSDYISTYVERDVRQLSQIHNISLFERFLGLCAGRVGQILNLSSLANDTGVSHTTASEWMTLLQASYVVYLLKPYYKNFKKRLIKSPKLYFYDTGLASRLLGIEKAEHVFHHPLRGNLFENLVVGELLKYRFNRAMPDPFYFYRDSRGNEVDVIYEIGGLPFPVEIKAGSTLNSDYFRNLNYFTERVSDRNPYTVSAGLLVYNGDRVEMRNDIQITHPAELSWAMSVLEK